MCSSDLVRCGGRLHDGGSHRYFGFTPDLAVYSKALGNGYSISACAGAEEYRQAAAEVFLTGSCWNDAIAMTAALRSLELSAQGRVAESVLKKGERFCSSLEKIAAERGVPLRMTGPSSMPYPWIDGDKSLFQIQGLCREAARQGLYLHPHHNWFISNAMTDADIDEALSSAAVAMDRFVESANGPAIS